MRKRIAMVSLALLGAVIGYAVPSWPTSCTATGGTFRTTVYYCVNQQCLTDHSLWRQAITTCLVQCLTDATGQTCPYNGWLISCDPGTWEDTVCCKTSSPNCTPGQCSSADCDTWYNQ